MSTTANPEQQAPTVAPRGPQLDTPLAVGIVVLASIGVIAAVRTGFGGALAHAK